MKITCNIFIQFGLAITWCSMTLSMSLIDVLRLDDLIDYPLFHFEVYPQGIIFFLNGIIFQQYDSDYHSSK